MTTSTLNTLPLNPSPRPRCAETALSVTSPQLLETAKNKVGKYIRDTVKDDLERLRTLEGPPAIGKEYVELLALETHKQKKRDITTDGLIEVCGMGVNYTMNDTTELTAVATIINQFVRRDLIPLFMVRPRPRPTENFD